MISGLLLFVPVPAQASASMAMAGRCLHRLLASAPAAPRFHAFPAFSTPASNSLHNPAQHAPAHDDATGPPGEPSSVEPVMCADLCGGTPLARHRPDSNPACLRVISSFSIIDGGYRSSSSIYRGHHSNSTREKEGFLDSNTMALGLQIVGGIDIHHRSKTTQTKWLSTKTSSPPSNETVVVEAKEENQQKTLEDFQHEDIVGPTVDRDLSPVADELRAALDILQNRILSFQKSLIVLGCAQGAGAVWCYVSWDALNPFWQLLPSALLSFLLAFVLRQALQPIAFFGKLEERSRLRIITLSLMIAKGFGSFFNRARILVGVAAVGLICGLLYIPLTYLLGLLGIFK